MTVVLRDVALILPEFVLEIDAELPKRTTALCGPSGAGKTTMLELIAGLRKPDRGSIAIGGRDLTNVPPRDRHVGYVPQDDVLFPHLSAGANILYGARNADPGHVEDVLEIASLRSRNVRQLSGGERKRVALARALVSSPQILLLDEPLAGVHSELRGRVLDYLVRVRDEFAIPMIYVTHDIDEASAVCDEIIELDRGRIRRRLLTSAQ